MSQIVQRRKQPLQQSNGAQSPTTELEPEDQDGFTAADLKARALPNQPPPQHQLTLMEELILLGLKDSQGYLSFWNDNISYVLRGLILCELSMRNLIHLQRDRKDFCECFVEVTTHKLTGEVLLDETLKLIKSEEQKYTVAQWIDLLSGETWNLMKISYQLKQVRERLAKSLVDKGILSTSKKNFLLFEMATHPLNDSAVVFKEEIVIRTRNLLMNRTVTPSRRTMVLACASYAANVLENALNYTISPQTSNMYSVGSEESAYTQALSYSQKDGCFAKCEELMQELGKNEKYQEQQERVAWTEVMTGVVQVFLKMDTML